MIDNQFWSLKKQNDRTSLWVDIPDPSDISDPQSTGLIFWRA